MIKYLKPFPKRKIIYHRIIDTIIKLFSRRKNRFFMSLVQQIASRSIGLDLTSVSPMPGGPTGKLYYLDYVYKPSIKLPWYKRIFKIFKK